MLNSLPLKDYQEVLDTLEEYLKVLRSSYRRAEKLYEIEKESVISKGDKELLEKLFALTKQKRRFD